MVKVGDKIRILGFLADSLTEKSAFADVQKAVEQLKSCIQGWHEQDKESIAHDEWVVKDWNFVHYALIMEEMEAVGLRGLQV